MSFRTKAAGLAAGVVTLTTALIGSAVPAQAYVPDPAWDSMARDTDTCPCSGGELTDPFDNTYFRYDAGGYAQKAEMYYDGWFVGKVEFHPYQQKLWIYDTKNDRDTFYVQVLVDDGGGYVNYGSWSVAGTDAVMDYRTITLNADEGDKVKMNVYDDADLDDLILQLIGTA
ncbi:hypothetical protein [Streptomyces sp. 2A115]|uniref:hypothetical protein n=1 Tax=Streptomyces sp. 2A115 TaxID=3457439 RepID=UPI003FD288B5